MNKYSIKINKVSKQYQLKSSVVDALKSVSFEIEEGSIFGLLGPNGAGKSTLINILAGSVVKTSGEINVCGDDFDKHPRVCKFHLGIVPQEIIIDPFFTVKEALEIYAGYYGVRPKDRITDELLSKLGLSDKANVKPRSLSGGMKRRLLIAKALVHKPKVLILDEPTAGVDVELRDQMWGYVKELNSQGTTIILTTHYLEEAEQLCDNIAVINNGEIIAKDKTSNLKKIFGEKELIISIDKISDQKESKLTKIFDDFRIIKSANHTKLSVKYKYNDLPLSGIIDFCTKNNIKIIDVETQESDLEDIFKKLIKKK
ncbi:MAG: ABC transporter ATP-binding protein [Rickettsiales bacterium]|nr:ABC transporter ATP-binding protein [Rickettsiales bacterium]